MKQKIILLLALTLSIYCVNAQIYTGPIPKPTTGYGSDGSHPVDVETFANPYYPTENIRIYHPSDITTAVPTLFYSHPFGGSSFTTVVGLLNFFASKGYAVVFVPYQTAGVSVLDRYENLTEGFKKAAQDYPNIIDTSRVGFLGHSFGGGATIGISYYFFSNYNWGQNGRFICPSAPWYSFKITQTELQSFPSDTRMLTFIYEDDNVNDHRMAIDIFNNINITASEKDFIKVQPSVVGSYNYTVGHDMPTTYAAFDALDYYAYYRLMDALCDYTFNGSLIGKDVALGNGSSNQVTMPVGMTNLIQTDTPIATYPENTYGFPCSAVLNPREAYCNSVLSIESNLIAESEILIFPNPVENIINISSSAKTDIEIFTLQGQSVMFEQNAEKINIQSLPSGIYIIKLNTNKKSYQYKIIKN